MATLFSVFDQSGTFMGSCSARCYDARGDISACVCGGVNHGKGLVQAARNTLTLRTIFPVGPHRPKKIEEYVVHYHSSIHRLAKQEVFAFLDEAHLETISR